MLVFLAPTSSVFLCLVVVLLQHLLFHSMASASAFVAVAVTTAAAAATRAGTRRQFASIAASNVGFTTSTPEISTFLSEDSRNSYRNNSLSSSQSQPSGNDQRQAFTGVGCGGPVLSRMVLSRMRVTELREELSHRQMDTSGPKKRLVTRLLGASEIRGGISSSSPLTVESMGGGRSIMTSAMGIRAFTEGSHQRQQHQQEYTQQEEIILSSSAIAATSSSSSSSSSAAAAAVTASKKENVSRTYVHRMRVAELRQELAHRNMDTSGLKKDLIPRLLRTLESEDLEEHKTSDATINIAMDPITEGEGPTLDPNRTYILRIKGISSHSSKGTGVGIVLIDETNNNEYTCWQARKYLHGNRNVFEAEYSALVAGLRYAIRRGAQKIIVQMDHDVVREQVNGRYPVDKGVLKGLYWNVMSLKETLAEFSTRPLTPLENSQARDLANQALATYKSMNIRDDVDSDLRAGEHFKSSSDSQINVEEEEEEDYKEAAARDKNEITSAPSVAAAGIIDPSQTYRLQFDGGARRNPTGVAGAGMVLYDEAGNEIWCGWKFLDRMSNNMAEYYAVLLGLQCARSLGIQNIMVEGDSELIVKQLKGAYRVKDEKLKVLHQWTRAMAEEFEHFEIRHIFRKDNGRADWLANHAMNTLTSHGFDEEE